MPECAICSCFKMSNRNKIVAGPLGPNQLRKKYLIDFVGPSKDNATESIRIRIKLNKRINIRAIMIMLKYSMAGFVTVISGLGTRIETSHYPRENIKKLLYNIFYELA
ncbi:hypothetical protein AU255_06190 [Methyloprofundus sedimenti]|uniref:Uncharacterized protein n=1 Tax=Methyloprofundus sedimenti TaxID=1420851 RepID=A0A1V8M7I4_9GAMM|nr:hypothetical protein AU255_06190 [Methyloprofundus sedimenti]